MTRPSGRVVASVCHSAGISSSTPADSRPASTLTITARFQGSAFVASMRFHSSSDGVGHCSSELYGPTRGISESSYASWPTFRPYSPGGKCSKQNSPARLTRVCAWMAVFVNATAHKWPSHPAGTFFDAAADVPALQAGYVEFPLLVQPDLDRPDLGQCVAIFFDHHVPSIILIRHAERVGSVAD